MASLCFNSSTSVLNNTDAVVSFPRNNLCHASSKLSFLASKLLHKPFSSSNLKTRPGSPIIPARASSRDVFDVVIVGAGIIGLTIARQLLIASDLSVAVVDKAVPCSGATGAGQGYIWMAHKTPGTEMWELTMRSHTLWEKFAESLSYQGLDPSQVLGWKKTGSLVVGQTPEESSLLKRKVKQFSEAGLRADYLSSHDLHTEEPDLFVTEEGGAAFLPDDCQLDAHRTVAFIENANRQFASKGRYAEFYHHPVASLLRSTNGDVEAVKTTKNIVYSKKAVIVAAGCWSGALMHDLFGPLNLIVDIPVMPRKGHLLVIGNFTSLKLNHGLMEVGYAGHQNITVDHRTSASGPVDECQNLSISMTATMDTTGNLVLGSSRQFSGFDTEVDESIVYHIWKRAGGFFPKLKETSLKDLAMRRKVRIGLRPYMPDGKPVIGPILSLSNLFIATGHEGGGLSLALGTAEMVADMVFGNPGIINRSAFTIRDS